jgi:hypothetical protein
MLLEIFNKITDHRRAQARQFDLPHILLFVVLAVTSGSHSYRMIHTFIKMNFTTLKKHYGIHWKRAPAYATIRKIIHGVNAHALEKSFREYSEMITSLRQGRHLSLDGKTVRGSFDHFQDKKAIQVFSALFTQEELVLAHEFIEGHKTNEIPIAQQLIKDLGLSDCIMTADAMHCQKKR